MNITFDEITRIRGLLGTKPPDPTDHCDDDCEHIECGYVVACEKYTAAQAQLATVIGPLLDALEHTLKESERFKRERDYYQNHRDELALTAKKQVAAEIAQLKVDLEQSRAQEQQTAAVLDGYLGDIEKAKNARVPTELFCPLCNYKHVDQGEWAHEIAHRKHLCAQCGHVWAPYVVGTVGVAYGHPTLSVEEYINVLNRDIAWTKSEWGSAVEENARLEKRRDELLATVANLSQSVPLESEVAEALNQRGALLAEIGTLKATIAEHDILLGQAMPIRQFLDELLDGLGKHLPRETPRTVKDIVAAVEWTVAVNTAALERNEKLVLMITTLQQGIRDVCAIATTPLPEDRQAVIEVGKLAEMELPLP